MLDRPELIAETKKCIRCGLCQSVCPSFKAIRNESAVARGRVRLIRELAEGRLNMTPRLKEDMFACLGCEQCKAICPAGIHIPEMISAMRSEYVAKDGLPFTHRAVLRGVLPHAKRVSLAAKAFRLGQKTKIVPTVARCLPSGLRGRLQVMPETLPIPLVDQIEPNQFPKDATVAYYLSCTTNYLTPSLGHDVLKVLAKAGYKAMICMDTLCCGKPQQSLGDKETAIKMAIHNVKALSSLPVEAIVVDCATCGSTLKEYPELLKGHPEEKEARELAQKTYDISEFLVKKGFKVGNTTNSVTVTYHDPCHLKNAQGVRDEPREILKALPGVNFVESYDSDRCCGGAGSYCLTHTGISDKILEPKVKDLLATKAQYVATGCPVCRMQIQYGLRNTNVKVVHPVELLARSFAPETDGGITQPSKGSTIPTS